MIGWRCLRQSIWRGHRNRSRFQRSLISAAPASRKARLADILGQDRPIEVDPVTVTGFVRSIRKQKRIAFAAIGDGTSSEPLQAVLRPEQAANLSNGCAVTLTGALKSSPYGKKQASELQVENVRTMGENDASNHPIQKKFQTAEFLRTIPHLRMRTTNNALRLHLRSNMISAATKFFEERLFVQTHTPIITSSDCEGAGEVFTVSPQNAAQSTNTSGNSPDGKSESFFRSTKYLTVSAQLHLEALSQSVERVWTLSPTFRAEQSDTQRHLSEFYMLEAEMCFIERLRDVTDLVEGLVKALTKHVRSSAIGKSLIPACPSNEFPEAGFIDVDLSERWERILANDWPRLTYHQAVVYLQDAVATGKARFETPVDDLSGLRTEHEKYLAVKVAGGKPIFVTDYPRAIKPFYMAPSLGSAEELGPVPTSACFDLLMPEVCEVAGGSMREHRLLPLQENMVRAGLLENAKNPQHLDGTEERLDWYLDLRRYGSVPHGGFGLGFDRLLGYLAGIPNIKDAVAFPRWHGRCTC